MSGLLQGRQVHRDQLLSNVALNYRPEGFIADQIFATIPVRHQSDFFSVWDQGDLWRRYNTKRSPGTEANVIETAVSSDNYFCQNFALKANVTMEDKANADPGFIRAFEGGQVELVSDALLMDWELRAATKVTNTSNVGSSAAVGSAWTDYTNSDPLGDTLTAIDNVKDATGYRPNMVTMSEKAWRNFRRNKTVIDKIGKTGVTGGDKYPSITGARDLLEVDKLLIGDVDYNTAEEGISLSIAQAWGDHVLVSYTQPRPSIVRPSFGYNFRWTAPKVPNFGVERHPYDTKTKTEQVEVGYYQDEKITASTLAFLVTNVTSST